MTDIEEWGIALTSSKVVGEGASQCMQFRTAWVTTPVFNYPIADTMTWCREREKTVRRPFRPRHTTIRPEKPVLSIQHKKGILMPSESAGVPQYVRVYDGRTNERLDELASALNRCVRAIATASRSGADKEKLSTLVIAEHADAVASLNVIGTMGHTIGTSFKGLATESSAFDLLLEIAKSHGS